jgi:transcriptional regulator with XRE-family HTH domain
MGLTQTEVDVLMGSAPGHYQKIEAGHIRPTSEYLLELARLLHYTDSEYIYVHLVLYGAPPADSLRPDAEQRFPPGWQRAVDGQQAMAYVNDRSFNLRHYNAAFSEMFPTGEPPANTMRWMLLAEEARDFCLVDWDTQWGPWVVPQFRAALAAHPDDPTLKAIHEEALADKRTLHLLENPDEVAHIHPDGDCRPLRHALKGFGFATMIAAQPFSVQGSRYMTVLFDPAEAEVS